MQWEKPDPDSVKDMLACSFANIQKEIFVNITRYFFENIENTDKNLYRRASDFSKDFNDFNIVEFSKLELKPEHFAKFCNYSFDFMNYIKKLNKALYESSISYAVSKLSFPNLPTLHMTILGCGSSIDSFLEIRDSGELDRLDD